MTGAAGNTTVLTAEDVLVFVCLEALGALAFVGNVTLAAVIIRYRYLTKASFVLMFNLACADIVHAIVTTSYFYPPIVLKFNHMPHLGCRIYTAIDWTAWAITITAFCWTFFLSVNGFFFLMDFCCVIKPQGGTVNFYSFGYEPRLYPNGTQIPLADDLNVYKYLYMPLEVATMIIVLVSNPVTLYQLWQRHKRKMALRRASAMLLEMSQTMTLHDGKHKYDEASKASEVATQRQQRQQQRIFVQIIAVSIIFFLYMFAYYVSYYLLDVESKRALVFNSLLYSTTHMINPVVYFGLNEEMRMNLLQMIGCRPVNKRRGWANTNKATTSCMPPPSMAGLRPPLTSTVITTSAAGESAPLINHHGVNNSNSQSATSAVTVVHHRHTTSAAQLVFRNSLAAADILLPAEAAIADDSITNAASTTDADHHRKSSSDVVNRPKFGLFITNSQQPLSNTYIAPLATSDVASHIGPCADEVNRTSVADRHSSPRRQRSLQLRARSFAKASDGNLSSRSHHDNLGHFPNNLISTAPNKQSTSFNVNSPAKSDDPSDRQPNISRRQSHHNSTGNIKSLKPLTGTINGLSEQPTVVNQTDDKPTSRSPSPLGHPPISARLRHHPSGRSCQPSANVNQSQAKMTVSKTTSFSLSETVSLAERLMDFDDVELLSNQSLYGGYPFFYTTANNSGGYSARGDTSRDCEDEDLVYL